MWAYAIANIYVLSGDYVMTSDSYCNSAEYAFGTFICGSDKSFAQLVIDEEDDGEFTIFKSLSFDVSAGETFIIFGELHANSWGGTADAFNTLQMNFTDDTYISAAVTTVPLPAAAWLFGSGLLGLLGISRKRRPA